MGLECGVIFRAKKVEADEMFDACGMVCHELIKASRTQPVTLVTQCWRKRSNSTTKNLTRFLSPGGTGEGVLSALKDRATGIDRTQQTRS